MQQLPQFKAAYDWFFSHWQSEVSAAVRTGNVNMLSKLEEKRDTLERGMFILMFGQFEKAVNDTFSAALAARRGDPNWTHRRGWDADSLGRKVPFETKLSMVFDKSSTDFRHIIRTYSVRNHCAHGGTTTPVGSINSLEADIYVWASQLRG